MLKSSRILVFILLLVEGLRITLRGFFVFILYLWKIYHIALELKILARFDK